MSAQNHPSAIIEDGAILGDNVSVGAYSIIGPNVKIGDNVTIHSHVVIGGDTEIGDGTKIFPFASIGLQPQDLKYGGEKSKLIIGKNNTIREHVTMNPGTADGGMETVVGDNCLFMMASHVAHDCRIGNNVIMANNATLAGHVEVGDYVVLGGLCAVHQFIRIGHNAVIGGMSGVDTDVIPFGRVKGERAFLAGLNLIGLERTGFSRDDIKSLQRAYKELFNGDGTMDQRIEKMAESYDQDKLVMKVVDFARNKKRFPLCHPVKKTS